MHTLPYFVGDKLGISRSLIFGLALSTALTTAALVVAQERISYAVSEIQQALADAGFGTGKPDGIGGKKSAAALKAFQRAAVSP